MSSSNRRRRFSSMPQWVWSRALRRVLAGERFRQFGVMPPAASSCTCNIARSRSSNAHCSCGVPAMIEQVGQELLELAAAGRQVGQTPWTASIEARCSGVLAHALVAISLACVARDIGGGSARSRTARQRKPRSQGRREQTVGRRRRRCCGLFRRFRLMTAGFFPRVDRASAVRRSEAPCGGGLPCRRAAGDLVPRRPAAALPRRTPSEAEFAQHRPQQPRIVAEILPAEIEAVETLGQKLLHARPGEVLVLQHRRVDRVVAEVGCRRSGRASARKRPCPDTA